MKMVYGRSRETALIFYLEVYDDSNNLIDFRNLGLDKFSINSNSSNITFYIGDHLRDAGFNNGTYNVRYRFFRKLSW